MLRQTMLRNSRIYTRIPHWHFLNPECFRRAPSWIAPKCMEPWRAEPNAVGGRATAQPAPTRYISWRDTWRRAEAVALRVVRLYAGNCAPLIPLSGECTREGTSEARGMRSVLMNQGITEDILLDELPYHLHGTCRRFQWVDDDYEKACAGRNDLQHDDRSGACFLRQTFDRLCKCLVQSFGHPAQASVRYPNTCGL